MSRWWLSWCLAVLASGARAQEATPAANNAFHATLWSIADGLPQGSINDIVVSREGELWLATFGGLVSFDGMRFRVFDIDTVPMLPSNRITALAEGEARELWLVTQSAHLVHMQAGKVRAVYPLPEESSEHTNEPLCLLRHPAGSLWVQNSSGSVWRFQAGEWSRVIPPGLGGHYDGLCFDAEGQILAAVGRELVRFAADGTELNRQRVPKRIRSLALGSQARIWIGTEEGPYQLDGDVLEPWVTEPRLPWPILSIHERPEGAVWFGTPRGPVQVPVGARPGDKTTVTSTGTMLPQGMEVRATCSDAEGNLWLGTSSMGLVRLRPNRMETIPALRLMGAVSALCSDGAGGAWVANECRGLTHVVSNGTPKATEAVPTIGGVRHCAYALLRDRRGRVWLGSQKGVLRREALGSEWQVLFGSTVIPTATGPLLELADGRIVLSLQAGELIFVDQEDRVQSRESLPGPVHALAEDAAGNLWIGSEGQVFRWTAGALTVFGRDEGIPHCSVRDFAFDENGPVWMATYGGGLVRWNQGKSLSLARAQGLPDTSLSKLLIDGGRMWISANMGLMMLELKELDAFAEGKRSRVEPVMYGPEAGLAEGTHGQPAGFHGTDGSLWFGTLGGVVRVRPDRFPFNPRLSTPRIERVLIDDEALPEPYEVPAGTRRLLIEYGAISLTAPQRVRFRYRMRGFDEAWTDSGGERSASFTDLNPGEYRFEIQARNEDGLWSSSAFSAPIQVLPWWWQRTWVQAIAALLLIAILLLLHRLRIRVLQRRSAVLVDATQGRMQAEERESRLREELAHVARVATAGELASSLAHEVNQPLAAIANNTHAAQLLLNRGSLGELHEILGDIGSQAERASAVIRRLREFLRKHPSERLPVDLNALIHETLPLLRREIADARVQVQLDLARDLPTVQADAVQLQQVVVNLLKNACEALVAQSGERRVLLRTQREGQQVIFEVVDNGPGLDPSVAEKLFQPYITTKPAGMGLGLAICRSIMEAHGGHLYAQRAFGQGLVLRGDLPLSSS